MNTNTRKTEAELIAEFLAKGGKAKVFEAAKPVYTAPTYLEKTDTRRTDDKGNKVNHRDCFYCNVGGSVSQVASLSEM